jgi:hypothetical protein
MRLIMRATRILLAFSALGLVAGSAVHAFAYPKAAPTFDASSLPSFYAAASKGLWLSDSASLFGLGLAFAALAAWPRLAAGSLIVLLALIPLASAICIYLTIGNFLPGHVLVAAGVSAALAGALRIGDRESQEKCK